MTPTIVVGLLFTVVTILAYWTIDARMGRLYAAIEDARDAIQRIELALDVMDFEEELTEEDPTDEN